MSENANPKCLTKEQQSQASISIAIVLSMGYPRLSIIEEAG
jgi:hypothetical protein